MTALEWGSRRFETELDRGVLYLSDNSGIVWNGLRAVTELADEVVDSDLYFDGHRFGWSQKAEDFSATLEVFSYPEEFSEYIGDREIAQGNIATGDNRKPFGMSYRSMQVVGYKIHLVYNATASSNDIAWASQSNQPELTSFIWQLATKPVVILGSRPTSHFVIDTEFAPPDAVALLEDILYGTVSTAPRLPTPQEVLDLFLAHAILVITDNGDGTWTATGPDEAFEFDGYKFQIKWPSALYQSPILYKISTM